MRRMFKILAIVIVLMVAGTYAIYALEYKGNYNVKAKVTVKYVAEGDVDVTGFTTTVAPTSVVQFWDLFKGHGQSGSEYRYAIYLTMNYSNGKQVTNLQGFFMTGLGTITSQVLESNFYNVSPGQATIWVKIVYTLTNTVTFQKTYSVDVG